MIFGADLLVSVLLGSALIVIGALIGFVLARNKASRSFSSLMNELSPTEERDKSQNMEQEFRTLLKDVRERQEDSEVRYRLLTENLAASVLVRELSGKIVYCSPFTEVLTGYALAEIYAASGDFFETVVLQEDQERYRKSLQVSLMGEPFQYRYRVRHKTGIEMWVESRTVPVIDDGGEVISSLTISLDVTGAVRYQRQVEERNRDLQDFTYMVSHDLKAPIFTIKGMLGILSEDLGSAIPEPAREPLDHIHRAATRLEQLVMGVLEYSRASSTELKNEPVNIGDVLIQVREDLAVAMQESGGSIEIEDGLPTVVGDFLPLSQIFTNLISNAIKYRAVDRAPKIRVSAQSAESPQLCRISVQDNGCGVPPDKLQSIFRPFQRLQGKEIEGSGIGLACVKRLVERLGGEIIAESDGQSGSTFLLNLRRADSN